MTKITNIGESELITDTDGDGELLKLALITMMVIMLLESK
jgi:hypothetical protein